MMLDPAKWYPVASSRDLPKGHVYQTALGGEPLAIWRDSAGRINIWEDRCPHRGVRLSIGNVVDDELRCQYHAWRFASGSGACTFIPAQPATRPPGAVRVRRWPVEERAGLVWTGLSPEGMPPPLCEGMPLRAISIDASMDRIEAELPQLSGATLFVQPVDAGRSVMRGILHFGTLHVADDRLERFRRDLELRTC